MEEVYSFDDAIEEERKKERKKERERERERERFGVVRPFCLSDFHFVLCLRDQRINILDAYFYYDRIKCHVCAIVMLMETLGEEEQFTQN